MPALKEDTLEDDPKIHNPFLEREAYDYKLGPGDLILIQFVTPEIYSPTKDLNTVEYRLAPRDLVKVEVWNHPELSGEHTVGPDGRITLPLIASVKVADLSRPRAAEHVAQLYEKYYPSVTVTVGIVKYVSEQVYEMGQVANPGALKRQQEFNSQHTIGPDGRITLPLVGPVRVSDLTRLQAAEQITELYQPHYNGVKATVSVERYTSNEVFILGQVTRPGAYHFEGIPTLMGLLAKAGGLVTPKGEAYLSCAVLRGRTAMAWIDL
ncbi:MAG: polysaccharide biosynthesis/export family protein, partial [Planctomycetes bacterium]|nr:polysaccharide biosynthesis/export family protein [Planctomycetota bacterium]